MKKNIITLMSILALAISQSAILAQTKVSPSPEASESATQSIKNSIKEKVEQKLTAIANQSMGIYGQITDLQDETVTVTADNETIVITTSDDTEYQKIPGARAIVRKDLKKNDYLIIKGNKSDNLLNAQTIQVVPAPTLPKRDLSLGTIKSISSSKITITTQTGTQDITIDSSTQYYVKNDKGHTAVKSKPAKNDLIFVAHQTAKNKTIPTALMVFLLPSEKNTEEATPSAKIQ